MAPGDVVLAALPQSDGVQKLRPAVLLAAMPPYGDWLACGVSTQLHHHVAGFDELLPLHASDFSTSGLRQASLIRLGFVSTLPRAQIGGVLGRIEPARLHRLVARLARHLVPQG